MEATQVEKPQEAPVQTAPAVLAEKTADQVRDALLLANARFRVAADRRIDMALKAWRRGSKAHDAHLARISTEYENAEADQFFFAGYDGLSWREAVKQIIV